MSWQALPKMDLFGFHGRSLLDFDDLGMHDFVRWDFRSVKSVAHQVPFGACTRECLTFGGRMS